jgi:hypothetical protein
MIPPTRRYVCLLAVLSCIPLLVLSRAWAIEPHGEFLAGNRARYSTAGNPKAKGLTITMEYPLSWKAKPGERPNIPQTFVSENGKGLEMATLLIRELPTGAPPSESEIAELFTPQALRELLPKSTTVLEVRSLKVDGLPGGWVHYEMQMNRVGVEMVMIGERYITYFDRRLIDVQFGVGGLASDDRARLEARYREFAPLFRLMANSLIIHDRYPTP